MKKSTIAIHTNRLFTLTSLVTILLLTSPLTFAQNIDFQWVNSGISATENYGYDVVTDASNNVIVTGRFSGEATFGPITLNSGSNICALFIAKYDDSGNILWAKQTSGTGYVKGYGITTDAYDNIIVTGCLIGTATFGSITLSSAGGGDIFVAKYDPLGNIIWARQHGSSGWDEGWDVITDQSGNVIITGFFMRTVAFESITLVAGYWEGYIFLVKYNASGDVLWAKQGGGPNGNIATDISLDKEENIFVTGYFRGSVSIGGIPLISSGSWDVFIAKYDDTGEVIWVQSAGGAEQDKGHGIATDGLGNCYVSGYFRGNATFSGITLTSNGMDDVFIAKYDPYGNVVWIKQDGGTIYHSAHDFIPQIITDEFGNSYSTGCFANTASFSGYSLTSEGGLDIYIVKYDKLGEVIWVKQAGGTGDDTGFNITLDKFNRIIVAGCFEGSSNFDALTIQGNDLSDIFIACLSQPNVPQGEFVTGGGWIYSAPGSYAPDPSLDGKANFGFTSKYKQGTTVPMGNTNFKLKAGDFKFKSTSYQWMYISGAMAILKGEGSINGTGSYGFMMSAIDGTLTNNGGDDKFRIRIWDDNGIVIYDNEMGASIYADPTTSLGGGSIVIHETGAKNVVQSTASFTEEFMDDEKSPTLCIYPNPAEDHIIVEVSGSHVELVQLKIYNTLGECMHHVTEVGAFKRSISISDYESGIYLLMALVNDNMLIQKVVVK